MDRQTNSQAQKSQKGLVERTDKPVLATSDNMEELGFKQEMDRISKDCKSFVLEDIRKTEDETAIKPLSQNKDVSSASSTGDFASSNSADYGSDADPTKPDDWSSSNFGAWKSRTRTVIKPKARNMSFWETRSRAEMEQNAGYTRLEMYTHSYIGEKQQKFLDESGLNDYQIKPTDRARKLSEPGNVSPRTKP